MGSSFGEQYMDSQFVGRELANRANKYRFDKVHAPEMFERMTREERVFHAKMRRQEQKDKRSQADGITEADQEAPSPFS